MHKPINKTQKSTKDQRTRDLSGKKILERDLLNHDISEVLLGVIQRGGIPTTHARITAQCKTRPGTHTTDPLKTERERERERENQSLLTVW